MPRLPEGHLTFDFPDDETEVSRYDDWSFYRNQFQRVCGRAKAVDFIFVEAKRTWLIEVKDYRCHPREKVADPADEVAVKIRDTLAGLAACRCNSNDKTEQRIAERALSTRSLGVVLHLEQPDRPSRLRPRVADPADLTQKLKQLLKPVDPHPRVVDRHSLHTSMRWTWRRSGACGRLLVAHHDRGSIDQEFRRALNHHRGLGNLAADQVAQAGQDVLAEVPGADGASPAKSERTGHDLAFVDTSMTAGPGYPNAVASCSASHRTEEWRPWLDRLLDGLAHVA